jgi:LPS-assembly lipoprotein
MKLNMPLTLNRTNFKRPMALSGVLVGCAMILAGCGFQPVYSTNGSGVGPVSIEQIDGRVGYFLRQELDRRAVLEQGSSVPRVLTVKIAPSFASAAVSLDGISSRTLYTLTANYSLASQVPAGKPITGVIATTVGYESLDQAYGDIALQADAEERAASVVAEQIWIDLRRQLRLAR